MKKILIILGLAAALLMMTTMSAMAIAPTVSQDYGVTSLTWTLATAQALTGDSSTATGVSYCRGPKKLIMTTAGGAVNQSFTITDDGKTISTIDGSAITSVTAETIILSTNDNIDTLKVTTTITSGTVSISLRCN